MKDERPRRSYLPGALDTSAKEGISTMIPDSPVEHEEELPALAGIASFFHWFEELLNILNGPLLMFGAGIALVDLLTDGRLTATSDVLLYAWAVSQALGIDTQLLGCFARARMRRGWAMAGWLGLGVLLGYAAWQAGYVFATQQAQHITERAALAQLNIDPTIWLGWRSFLAVGLVALSGWTRYRRPKPSYSSEAEKLRQELALQPLRAQLAARKVLGLRGVAEAALRGTEAAPIVPPNDEPPTPPTGGVPAPAPTAPVGSLNPLATQEVRTIVESMPEPAASTRSMYVVRDAPKGRRRNAPGRRTKVAKRDTSSVEDLARAAWRPDMTISELQAETGISRGAASKYLKLFEAQHSSVESA